MRASADSRAHRASASGKPPRTPLGAVALRNGASVAGSPALRAAAVDESPLLSRSAERELLRQLGQMGAAAESGDGEEGAPQPDPGELVVDEALSQAAEAAADADEFAIATELVAYQRADAEVERIQATANAQVERVAATPSSFASARVVEDRIAQVRAEASREVEEALARAQEAAHAAQIEADARVAAAAKQVEDALAKAEQYATMARQGTQRAAEEQAELQRQIDARAAALAAQAAERIAQAHAVAEGSVAMATQEAERAVLERAEKARADAASTIAKIEEDANERVERMRREAALQVATHEEQLAGAHALAAQAAEQCDNVVQATDKQIAELRQLCAAVQEQAEASQNAVREEATKAVEDATARSEEMAAQAQTVAIENEALRMRLRQLEAQTAVQVSAAQEHGAVAVRETELMLMKLMQAWSNRRALLDAVRAWRLVATSAAARRRTLQRTAQRLQTHGMQRVVRSWAMAARQLRKRSMVQWQRRLHEQLAAERAQAAGERSEAEELIMESQQAAEELCTAAESARGEVASAKAQTAAVKLEAEEAGRLAAQTIATQEAELKSLREQVAMMQLREEQWSSATAAAISASIADVRSTSVEQMAVASTSSAGMISVIRPLATSSADGSSQYTPSNSAGAEQPSANQLGEDGAGGNSSIWSSMNSTSVIPGVQAATSESSQAEAVDAA